MRNLSCTEFGKQRDEWIKEWLRYHPSTTAIIANVYFEGRRHKAYRRLERLKSKRQVRCIGTVLLGNHRPNDVFYNGPHGINPDELRHEVMVTEAIAAYCPHCTQVKRFSDVSAVLPDAELTIGSKPYYLELHTGSMRGQKIHDRIAEYRNIDNDVLWVCLDTTRVNYLLGLGMPPNHWFGQLGSVQADPFGFIWVNSQGTEMAVDT